MSSFENLVYKRQKVLLPIALFLIACAIGFRFNRGMTTWVWNDYPFIALILALGAVLIAWIWATIEKQKTQSLIDDLKNQIAEKSNPVSERIEDLSLKQKEVFNLIALGKSNKEIMSDLHIELSTLKTHINQIYKKLGISRRKDVHAYAKSISKEL
ncbi:MAG: LuxR C-terminal-related transcriptional regulator [Saprospiraceae bacterium]